MNRQGGWVVAIVLCGCPAATPMTGPAPQAPASAASGETSSEPGVVTLPDVVGKLQPEAEAALHAAGIANVKTDNDPGTVDFAKDKVCSQTPGGGHGTRASLPVVLRYCSGPVHLEDKRVNLVGLTIEDAKARARAAGFTGRIEVIEAGDVSCAMGTVCSVSPDRWELDQSHVMELYTPKKLDIKTPD